MTTDAGAPSVYLVDDDAAVRDELAEALSLRGFAVTTFAGGQELLDVQAGLAEGCIVLDVNMPGLDGMEVHRRLLQAESAHKVVMLTGAGTISMAVSSVQAGAVDFLEKPFHLDGLSQAIQRAIARIRDDVRKAARRSAALASIERLSQREREVMEGLVLGLPNKIIAFRLGLSTRTVEAYRAKVMDKLEVTSVSDIVRLAAEADIVPSGAILREGGPPQS